MTDTISVTTTTTTVTTTAVPEDANCLVRVRAQVMSRDDSSGGWVPLLGGGLSNVSVRRRIINHGTTAVLAAVQPTTSEAAIAATSSSITPNGSAVDPNGLMAPTVLPEKHDYVIDGRRISDQSIVLSCTMKKDFEYNKVMPTFHHWKTGEKRFGLTFQTAADARAFDKGVRTAFEDLLDGLTGSFHLCAINKGGKREKDEPYRDDDVFMTLDLPQEINSRSSSNSSSKTSVQMMRSPTEVPALFYDPVGKGDKGDKGGNYTYVQLHAMHDYTYPSVATVVGTPLISPQAGGKKPIESTTTTSSSGVSTTTVIQQQPTSGSGKASPEMALRQPPQQQHLCRYCHERFAPGGRNKAGSCEYAPDPCRVCINSVSCIRAAECVSYHCAADAEGELPQSPCACACPGEAGDERCMRRWLCVTLLSLFVPCLWLYPILNACHWCGVRCGLCGGRHAAMPMPIPPAPHN